MEQFGYVMATKMLVDQKRKVRFMYRETPSNGQDSGWRFFCGEEDQDYVDNPDHLAIYDVETIIALDGSIVPYLQAAVGTALERRNEEDVFTVSQDYVVGGEDE